MASNPPDNAGATLSDSASASTTRTTQAGGSQAAGASALGSPLGALSSLESASSQIKPKRSSAVKARTRGGVRTMKMYSLTEGELGELAQLQGGATVAFAFASACAGFAISIAQGFAFSEHLSPIVQGTWETWMRAAIVGFFLSAATGIILRLKGRDRLSKIKAEMEHD